MSKISSEIIIKYLIAISICLCNVYLSNCNEFDVLIEILCIVCCILKDVGVVSNLTFDINL